MDVITFPEIDKPLVIYRFYCMALFDSQTRRHMIKKGMLLCETKVKGMTIFFKYVENDLSMLNCHLYDSLKLFHSLLNANQNYLN